MAFIKVGTFNPNSGNKVVGGSTNTPMITIIANSGVVKKGDAVVYNSSGFIARATNASGQDFVGILMGVADANGQFTASDSGTTDTWTVASDNQTVGLKFAQIDIDTDSIWSALVVGTIGTTVSSQRPGYWINLNGTAAADAGQVAETSATRTATTQGQFLGLGTDPNTTTRLLVKMNNSLFDNGVQI